MQILCFYFRCFIFLFIISILLLLFYAISSAIEIHESETKNYQKDNYACGCETENYGMQLHLPMQYLAHLI